MKHLKQDKLKKIISIVFLVLWCFVIFFFSNQNGELSTNSSSLVIDIINKFLRLFNAKIDILNYKYTVLIIRKLAHMFVYFVLYLVSYNCFSKYKLKKAAYLAILFCFGYALTDEFHQLFVVGRSGQITDCIIDTCGSILAFFFLKMLALIKTKYLKSKNN